jgi:hypothetical protein
LVGDNGKLPLGASDPSKGEVADLMKQIESLKQKLKEKEENELVLHTQLERLAKVISIVF